MEKELFDWQNWDGDQECMNFYNCCLKKRIGHFPPTSKFAAITIDNVKGTIELVYDGDRVAGKFKLAFTIGDEIK